jgi:hypothetical protein
MTISPRFICVLAVALSLSTAALSQATSGPTGSTEAPGTAGAAGNNASPSDTRRSGDSTLRGPRPQQPPSQSSKEPSKGAGADPTAVQESPSITGNGTAGEGL